MINLIEAVPVKAPVIADFQCLGLGDAPFHKGINLILNAGRFVCRDANIVQGVLFLFQPVDLFGDQMGLELAGTPAHTNTRPAVPIGRYTQLRPVFKCFRFFFRLVEHKPFKTLGVAQDRQVDAPFLIQYLVDLIPMAVHFGKFHACVRRENAVNGHPGLQHKQEHGRRVLAP